MRFLNSEIRRQASVTLQCVTEACATASSSAKAWSINPSSTEARAADKDSPQSFQHITEVVTSNSPRSYDWVVFPILQSLLDRQEQRWITFVTNCRIDQSALKARFKHQTRVRIIYTDDKDDALWATWEALAHGNSSVVVSQIDTLTLEHLDLEQKYHLNHAAELGRCHLLVLGVSGVERGSVAALALSA